MAAVIVKKLLGLVLAIVALLRRLLCFLGRRRRNSGMLLPMTSPALDNHTQSVPSNASEPLVMESWDNWGDSTGNPNNKMAAGSEVAPGEELPEVDYFTDMMPQFRKPTRIVLKKNLEENNAVRTNRFNMNADITYKDPGLDTWDEGENAWEGEMDGDMINEAEHVIRENKLQDRERRLADHQRKKLDKSIRDQRTTVRDNRLGTRLS